MSSSSLHTLDTLWTSSNPVLLAVSVDPQGAAPGSASNRLVAESGASGVFAEFAPAAAMDLSQFEELRFWIRADRPADGSARTPFFLEFSYIDAGDAPGEEHRWFVPVNQANTWEQRKIGLENDRRSAIVAFRFTGIVSFAFTCNLDDLLALRPEMLPDLEAALLSHLSQGAPLPGLALLPLTQTSAPGANTATIHFTPGFAVGNRILLQGGSAGDEERAVTAVTNDQALDVTTLQLGAPVAGNQPAGVATVTLLTPVMVEAPPAPLPATTPMILATYLSAREDPQRTGYFQQRDSFRPRGALVLCSLRPPARAYLVDYQLTVIAPNRGQQLFIQNRLLQQMSMDSALPLNGAPAPVWILAPPELDARQTGLVAPMYVRVGAFLETGPRQEATWVQRTEVRGAPLDAPTDQEGIVLQL